jgi:hypothetical protein
MEQNVPEEPQQVKSGFKALIARGQVAQIERFRELVSPYDLLVAIERHQHDACDTRSGATRFGMAHYARFIAMVATWPASDQDALLHAARRIFRVNIPTMRADVKAARMGVTLDRGAA